MTSKERMLKAMQNGKPDCVPVAPDMSNMIPCRLTGKPFWDIYLYQDPPLWKAYIGAAKHFGIDGWLAGVPLQFDYEIEAAKDRPGRQEAIIKRTSERIYTRFHADINGEKHWSNYCNVYYIADPPTRGLPLAKAGLPDNAPTEWEDVHRRTNYKGLKAFHEANEYMGDDGVVGVAIGIPGLNLRNMDSIYEYYDNREKVIKRCQQSKENLVRRL
ncbi:hypothetical protein GF312_21495, partial [Candidatus Poribacteria bacterium]|nr:hypothetical protein [Candidatus Poribacteria bacterium]